MAHATRDEEAAASACARFCSNSSLVAQAVELLAQFVNTREAEVPLPLADPQEVERKIASLLGRNRTSYHNGTRLCASDDTQQPIANNHGTNLYYDGKNVSNNKNNPKPFSFLVDKLLSSAPDVVGISLEDRKPIEVGDNNARHGNKEYRPNRTKASAADRLNSPSIVASKLNDSLCAASGSNSNCESHLSPQMEECGYVKLLASQLVAGTLIGKGGKGLNWFRRRSGVVDIFLSMPWELFPGTDQRVVVLKGKPKSLLKGLNVVVDLMKEKLDQMCNDSLTECDQSTTEMCLRLVVPKSSVGFIIGKKGEYVQATQDSTGASIFVMDDNKALNVQERICVISGNDEQLRAALKVICSAIQNDKTLRIHSYVSYGNCCYTLANPLGSEMVGAAPELAGGCQEAMGNNNEMDAVMPVKTSPFGEKESSEQSAISNNTIDSTMSSCREAMELSDSIDTPPSPLYEDTEGGSQPFKMCLSNLAILLKDRPDILCFSTEISAQVPVAAVGTIIGSNGRHVREIQTLSGASVNISRGHDLNCSAGFRTVQVSGTLEAVYAAYALCVSRLLKGQDRWNTSNVMQSPNGAVVSRTATTAGGEASTTVPPPPPGFEPLQSGAPVEGQPAKNGTRTVTVEGGMEAQHCRQVSANNDKDTSPLGEVAKEQASKSSK